MKKLICLIASSLVLTVQANAQLKCGADQVFNQLKKNYPEINVTEANLSLAIQEAIEKEKTSGTILGKTTATTYDVPIVVHIIHDYGAEYISDDDIFNAVKYWDVVFNKENADTINVIAPFKRYIGNPQIRLHLATIDPSGNPTKGITRRQSYLSVNGGDNAKMDGWPNNKYINIWFINKFDAKHSGAAAYAYYPAAGAALPYYDGIISLASYMGTDKTIPHELGHVLNLQHTWGNTNDPEVACGDDLVDDTPPTKGHASCGTAALYDTTCSRGYVKGSINYPDTNNTQNIMEYAFCSKMFTLGQASRMRAALTSTTAGRSNLISSTNLTTTGALQNRPDLQPIPDFSVERGIFNWGGKTTERTFFLCQNSSTIFQFQNRSWNDTVTNVAWSFSNTPASATSSLIVGNVSNSFKDAGWATITLTATGNNSGSKTINRQAIYVASTTPYSGGYNQYFTALSDFGDWPMFNYYNNNFKWEYNSSNGYPNGSGCVRYRSFDARTSPESLSGNPDGDYDDIFTPAFNCNTISGATGNINLNFYTAGCATGKTVYKDSLQIFASNTCGDSWTRIGVLSYADIINNGILNTEFAPTTASQWKAQTITVPASLRSDKTFFRFRYWPSTGGNNLYFDNFTLSPWTTEIKEVAQNASEVKIFPNPSNGDTKLYFTTGNQPATNLVIRDVTGKTIFAQSKVYPSNTFIQEDIQRSIFPSSGIYLISIINSEHSHTKKLVIE
ncbi:MAG: M43 family zinc metalloprotease [Phycisphaerales bacterium]|nr:M43 family zinc metalloprotease [Phycisphaerales bacterium]